jgi:hypothetical protein
VSEVPDPFHVDVARLALSAAEKYGFALGGGHALVAHGLLRRPTDDIDLFTDAEGGVRDATVVMLDVFESAGYEIEAVDDGAEVVDLFEGFDDAFVEFDVWRDDRAVRMSLARMDRRHAPVALGIGPVMHLDDLVGAKMCALGTRAEVRDYVDVSAALDRYPRERLVALARSRDPELGAADFASAAARLDSIPDDVFHRYDLTADDIATLRQRFAEWPRD